MSQHSYLGLLGKRPARLCQKPRVRFGDVVDLSKLSPVPTGDFGHENLLKVLPDLGNDELSDCVIAGGGTEESVWTIEGGHPAVFNRAAAITNYTAYTGYNPNAALVNGVNPTDRGTDMVAAAEKRMTDGLVDANGVYHKIGAYISLEPGNIEQLWQAIHLFDGVGIGVLFPDEWMTAVEQGQIWDYVDNPTVNEDDGHYVTAFGRINGNIALASFAMWCQMTTAGYQEFNDLTLAYLTEEKVKNGVDLEGLSYTELRSALNLVEGMGSAA
jgi:hypothetical protein